jgi:signal transduction histidine kinase
VLQEGNTIVSKNLDSGLPPVLADAPALTRCLQNLLSNAIKYGQDGHLRLSRSKPARRRNGSAGKIQLSVTDHGPVFRA